MKPTYFLWTIVMFLALTACTAGVKTATPPAAAPATELPAVAATPTTAAQVPATPLAASPTAVAQAPAATPLPTASPTPEPPAASPTPQPAGPSARQAANVRGGPGTVYPIIGGLRGGDPVNIIARNPAGDWFQIRLPNGNEGWVAASLIANASATGLPVAANIPPLPTPAPTATPPPPPTPGTEPPDTTCTEFPIRGFGKVWNENKSARDMVGCTSYTVEKGMKFLAQRFERGVMFWTDANFYDNRGVVWVLFTDNYTYARVADTYSQGEAEPTPQSPPEGKLEPRGKLGKAWREGAGVQKRLGWAIAPEVSGNGSWQEFERGLMFWIPFGADRRIYVLGRWYPWPPGGRRNDWLEFIDTFAG